MRFITALFLKTAIAGLVVVVAIALWAARHSDATHAPARASALGKIAMGGIR